ncbi:heme-binding protein (plasmid) [Skermanella mucosa]|uniref:GlcG/HbpS family heme-binding protein n=1 Tax=Skermanella mucosa TaxID=1789672 RepID=UPI00192B05A6|nr:heme-binding protein [Skermanella mucosa]UEM24787.1 heme-binding protein [Skermanella mucosa]
MSSDILTKKSIGTAMAGRMIAAAEAKAVELGIPMAISIADESGVQKAFVRMDGAPLLAIQVAVNKAKTAAGFGIPTHVWHDFIKDDAPLALGAPHIDGLVVFGGGYPIKAGDAVIGAIGVSGGHYSDDMKVAEAALAAVS